MTSSRVQLDGYGRLDINSVARPIRWAYHTSYSQYAGYEQWLLDGKVVDSAELTALFSGGSWAGGSGLVVRGLVVRGLAVRGLAVRGLVARGLAVRGPVAHGPVVHGLAAAGARARTS
ncbi:MAG: hypothetical protein R2706_02025 [Acidimicrobiales bacterium]